MIGKVVEIQDFSIVVVADKQNPSILNPDFLKYNHIVPPEWELAMPPICTPSVSQVIFKNGVNIVAQSDKITFWEAFEPDNFSFKIPSLSTKYIEALPYIGYQAVGINFTGYVVADTEEDTQSFFLNRLIASGPWQSFQDRSPDVAIQFTYPRENGDITITLETGTVSKESLPEEDLPALIVSSNFHRDILGVNFEEQATQIKENIQAWETNFNDFKILIEKTFLSE